MAATTVPLPSAADTALFQNNPNNNLGGMSFAPIGVTALNTLARGLYKFDLSEIPVGSTVISATLELSVVGQGLAAMNVDFTVHRLLRDWGEGNKVGGPPGGLGAAAEEGEATWHARFFPSDLWATSGGAAGTDYVSDASATETVSAPDRYSFTSAALAADVQAWINNPGTNFGWLIKQGAETVAGSARRFGTREDSFNAPVLRVEYEGEAGPEIENPQVASANFQFQFQAEADKTYTVEYTADLTQSIWNVLTNLPAGTSGTAIITDPLGSGNRFYRIAQQ